MLAYQRTTAIYPMHKIHDITTLNGIHNVSAIQCGWRGGTYTRTKEGQATSKAGKKTKTKECATRGGTEAKTAYSKCNGISVTALNLYIDVIKISMILRCTLVQ